MIDSVKSISPNALLQPGIGTRIYIRVGCQGAMEPGVEDCNLKSAGSKKMIDGLDGFELKPVVSRSEFNFFGYGSSHLGCQGSGLAVNWTAMYDAMPYCVHRTGNGLEDRFQNRSDAGTLIPVHAFFPDRLRWSDRQWPLRQIV